jgi:hypothetical protein
MRIDQPDKIKVKKGQVVENVKIVDQLSLEVDTAKTDQDRLQAQRRATEYESAKDKAVIAAADKTSKGKKIADKFTFKKKEEVVETEVKKETLLDSVTNATSSQDLLSRENTNTEDVNDFIKKANAKIESEESEANLGIQVTVKKQTNTKIVEKVDANPDVTKDLQPIVDGVVDKSALKITNHDERLAVKAEDNLNLNIQVDDAVDVNNYVEEEQDD